MTRDQLRALLAQAAGQETRHGWAATWAAPGEALARLEQLAQHMRRTGGDSFTVPLSQLNRQTHDLSRISGRGWDWSAHRLVPRD